MYIYIYIYIFIYVYKDTGPNLIKNILDKKMNKNLSHADFLKTSTS